jgi:ubiquinone biosynthesis protein
VLLQKTLLNVEGLGRQLDPDLDLWVTAKPFLERWMREQLGWRGVLRRVRQEAELWSVSLPEMPRLAHEALQQAAQRSRSPNSIEAALHELSKQVKTTRRWLIMFVWLLAMVLAGAGLLLSGLVDLDSIDETSETQTLTRTQQTSTVWRRSC